MEPALTIVGVSGFILLVRIYVKTGRKPRGVAVAVRLDRSPLLGLFCFCIAGYTVNRLHLESKPNGARSIMKSSLITSLAEVIWRQDSRVPSIGNPVQENHLSTRKIYAKPGKQKLR
jgi:hypothetical protein